MRIPAVCDTCGTFFPSGIEVKDSYGITFSGVTYGPCPNCGGKGHILDGTYNFIDNTIQLLSGPTRTISELERLSMILRQAKAQGASLEQVGNQIQKELPELSSLKDLLPKSRSDFYHVIEIILLIIALILGQLKIDDSPKIEVNQVINLIYQQETYSQHGGRKAARNVGRPTSIQAKSTKIGRNEPCPCGSGKKYKKCCLGKMGK